MQNSIFFIDFSNPIKIDRTSFLKRLNTQLFSHELFDDENLKRKLESQLASNFFYISRNK